MIARFVTLNVGTAGWTYTDCTGRVDANKIPTTSQVHIFCAGAQGFACTHLAVGTPRNTKRTSPEMAQSTGRLFSRTDRSVLPSCITSHSPCLFKAIQCQLHLEQAEQSQAAQLAPAVQPTQVVPPVQHERQPSQGSGISPEFEHSQQHLGE